MSHHREQQNMAHYETMGLGIRDKWKVHLLLSNGDGRVQD